MCIVSVSPVWFEIGKLQQPSGKPGFTREMLTLKCSSTWSILYNTYDSEMEHKSLLIIENILGLPCAKTLILILRFKWFFCSLKANFILRDLTLKKCCWSQSKKQHTACVCWKARYIRRVSRLCGLAWHHIIARAKKQYWMVITVCQKQHWGLYYNRLCVYVFVCILHNARRHLPISKHLIMLKFILSQPRLYFLST